MRQITIMAAGMSTHTLDTHAVMTIDMNRRSSWLSGRIRNRAVGKEGKRGTKERKRRQRREREEKGGREESAEKRQKGASYCYGNVKEREE